ncbi:hypothetical protein HYALB_00012558 [Hymenoscyphus albidus]|uniref:Uncharacterized protein n=1 Tax=Hymenoscyphus albidus TaxID=595503 RepID=A0A9N9LX34_9HELO|nr:hypothetical protein HYALB_00012558 [Hymenoscyphus albidus]
MLASFLSKEIGERVTPGLSTRYVLPTPPPWEEGVRELLRTTHNWDTIRHICQLPFRDLNTPQVTLLDRWDSGLDSFLISFAAGAQSNEILEWTRDRKARELFRLLQPVRGAAVWMWSWTPPNFAFQDPCAIADELHNVVYAAVHRVTFQEWVSYLYGHEEHAVTSLLCGVWNTREILHRRLSHRVRNKYIEVEEELHSRHPLAHWILASGLQFSSPQPQDALNHLFRPILDLFASKDPACIVNRFAVLDIRFTLMAEEEGNWSKLSTNFSFLEGITCNKLMELAESITDTESELFRHFSVDDFLQYREETRFTYAKQWSALSDDVFACLTADRSLVGRVTKVHLRLLRNQSSLIAVLDGIRRSKIPPIELSEISKLFRLVDSHNNYAFYRKQSSKESNPVLPFLLPYFQASTMNPVSGLNEFFQFVPYFGWRQRRGRLVEGESDLSQIVRGDFGIEEHPDIEQCLQVPKSSDSLQSTSSRIRLLRSSLPKIRDGQRGKVKPAELQEKIGAWWGKPSNIHKRVLREPRLRRNQAYCCNCDRKRKYVCRDVCPCQHVRKGCDACLQRLNLATEPLNPGKIVALDQSQVSQSNTERIRASLALKSLLIHTSVSFSEIFGVIDQLSSEECRLLSCTREQFSQKEFFYRFAVGGTGAEDEDMRKLGALYNPGLTVEELCKLWNCLIKNIKSKVKFLPGDTWEAQIFLHRTDPHPNHRGARYDFLDRKSST